jgi:hypothetical protein
VVGPSGLCCEPEPESLVIQAFDGSQGRASRGICRGQVRVRSRACEVALRQAAGFSRLDRAPSPRHPPCRRVSRRTGCRLPDPAHQQPARRAEPGHSVRPTARSRQACASAAHHARTGCRGVTAQGGDSDTRGRADEHSERGSDCHPDDDAGRHADCRTYYDRRADHGGDRITRHSAGSADDRTDGHAHQ